MKRMRQLALVCVMVLMVVSLAAAQQVPTQVIRVGEWVEVGGDVFMNIIASSDIRYSTTSNYDFEDRIQDRVPSRDNLSTVPHTGEGDILWAENRIGVDFRYQKNLLMQVLFEHQSTLDGNLIDQQRVNVGPPVQTYHDGQTLAAAPQQEANTVNLERFWIDYTFSGPLNWLRMRVGADLWFTDQAGVVADDDPRFAVFAAFGPRKELQLEAAAVIQMEALRLGLQNDNDYVYYTFGVSYDPKPIKVGLHGAYFRDRFTGAHGQTTATNIAGVTAVGQKIDSIHLMPSVTGSFGPVRFLLEGLFVYGWAEGANALGNRDYNILAWGGVGQVSLNLGVVQPFVGVVYGSGDEDPTDRTLQGFAPVAHREITIMTGTPYFQVFDTASSWGARDVPPPARSRGLTGAVAANQGGTEHRHTVGNPFSDRIGNVGHTGINTVYSNPGTLLIPAGVTFLPLRGHQLDLYYVFVSVTHPRLIEVAFNTPDVRKNFAHEAAFQYQWTPSPHFDIRLVGGILFPDGGARDVAATTDCNFNVAGLQPCEGEDVALKGEARIRARF